MSVQLFASDPCVLSGYRRTNSKFNPKINQPPSIRKTSPSRRSPDVLFVLQPGFGIFNSQNRVMRSIILNLLLLVSTAAVSQPTSASPFKNTADLGNPATAGTSVFDPVTQQLTITAAGSSVDKRSGHWSFSAVKGDFILTAEVSIEATLTPGQSVGIRAESSGLSVIGSSHSDGISSLKWAATGSQ
ncbi:MAG: hypothetical protein ACKOYP_03030, partial [Bacteroidota bacterium]